jgi:hypothetical protein
MAAGLGSFVAAAEKVQRHARAVVTPTLVRIVVNLLGFIDFPPEFSDHCSIEFAVVRFRGSG